VEVWSEANMVYPFRVHRRRWCESLGSSQHL